jgi:hypothetical protein
MNTCAAEVQAAVGFEFGHETFTAAVDAPTGFIKLAEHNWESTEFGHQASVYSRELCPE